MASGSTTARKYLVGAERFLEKAVDIVVVLLLLIGLYYLYDSFLVLHSTPDEMEAYHPTRENPSAYASISEECVAWIALYNTGVDYPVMQGKSNSEYLNKDPFGAYSLTGSIFLDSRNDRHFTDEYSLLYGHHVDGGRMFGALDAFANRTYFNEHRNGELVVDGEFHKIEAFAFAHTDASEGLIFDPSRPGDRLDWVRANATIYEEPVGARIVALSTCKSPASTTRTIVFVSIVD